MSRLIRGSRVFLLGVAFVGVMAGTGGLMGAIAGVILMLLGRAVMGLSEGMAGLVLVPASVGFGATVAISLGVFLVARQAITFTWQPRLISTPAAEHESVPS